MNQLDLNKTMKLGNRKPILSLALMHNTLFLFALAIFGITGINGQMLKFLMRAGTVIYPTSFFAIILIKAIMTAEKINTVSSQLHELHNEKDESLYEKLFCYVWMIIQHLPFFIAVFLELLLVTGITVVSMKYLPQPLFGAWTYMAVKTIVLIFMYQNTVKKCQEAEDEINKILENKKGENFTWNI